MLGKYRIAREKHFITGWYKYKQNVRQLMEVRAGLTVLEVGGGRTPLFTPEELPTDLAGYIVNDIDARELERLPSGYNRLCADICSPDIAGGLADLVFSRMVGEHIRDGRAFHGNIFRLLKPGGTAFHFIPILFSPPFVLNKLLPETLSRKLVSLFFNRRNDAGIPIFPAYYSLCRGPSAGMRRIFREIGFRETEIHVFYGHGYFRKIPLLRRIDYLCSWWSARHDFFWLGSYAYIKAVK